MSNTNNVIDFTSYQKSLTENTLFDATHIEINGVIYYFDNHDGTLKIPEIRAASLACIQNEALRSIFEAFDVGSKSRFTTSHYLQVTTVIQGDTTFRMNLLLKNLDILLNMFHLFSKIST